MPFYTGVNADLSVQVQCLATGNDDLTRWDKFAENPVIADPPSSLGQTRDIRDPFVWRQDGNWYMVLATHIVGVGGAVLLYRSANLTDWEYLHPLYVGEQARNGRNFECANFFQLGEKWVLLVSIQWDQTPGYTLYLVGRWENLRFIPEYEGVYDAGYSYASLCPTDEAGQRLVFSWLREGRSVDLQRESGWTGVQSIPRILSLDDKNRLISKIVPEFETLRGARRRFSASDLAGGTVPLRGLSLDIEAEFDVNVVASCGIELAASADGSEGVSIRYDRSTRTLSVYIAVIPAILRDLTLKRRAYRTYWIPVNRCGYVCCWMAR